MIDDEAVAAAVALQLVDYGCPYWLYAVVDVRASVDAGLSEKLREPACSALIGMLMENAIRILRGLGFSDK